MSPISIRKLLEEPFGPYPDDEILSDTLRNGTILNIQSLSMECAGSPVGFDESEYIGSAPSNSRIARHPVNFYGKLEIESLDWLSDQGRQWLEMDLRKRDQEINLQYSVSGLTLARLYGTVKKQGSRITVWIQGEKNMPARFMISSHPESLIIHSKKMSEIAQHKSRMYNVLSLDVGTFETSQNFLMRYRLWALIDEIIKTDPEKTPLEDRTIDWLVDNYLSRFRNRDHYHRYIFDPYNDEDVDYQGATTKPRYPRHISRSEIIGIFGAHADWLLAQQLAPSSASLRKVNIPKWISFCERVKAARRDARFNHIRWGLPYNVDSDFEDAELNLSRFGNKPEFWNKRIKNVLKTPKSRSMAQGMPLFDTDEALVHRKRPPVTTFVYDSDFSEVSTPAASDSDQDNHSSKGSYKTPVFCLRPPEIPAGRFEWHCPGCTYSINLLEIATGNANRKDAAQYPLTRRWKSLNEDHVQEFFYNMVSDHYFKSHISIKKSHVLSRVEARDV